MTRPGPTGRPVERRTRAKCMMLVAILPASPLPCGGRESRRARALSAARASSGMAFSDIARTGSRPRSVGGVAGRGDLALHLIENSRRLAAANPGDVVLVLEQH